MFWGTDNSVFHTEPYKLLLNTTAEGFSNKKDSLLLLKGPIKCHIALFFGANAICFNNITYRASVRTDKTYTASILALDT